MTSIRTDCQSSIQPDFEHYQWWSIHNFFGQPSSMSLHPCYKMFLPWFNLFTLIQLKKYCPFAITDRSESQSLFISPLYILKDHFPEVFFSRLNDPNILSAFLQRTGVPLITYVALLWTCSNRSICVFTEEPRAGYLIPGQVLWEWCRVGETPSSWPAVHYFFLFLFFFSLMTQLFFGLQMHNNGSYPFFPPPGSSDSSAQECSQQFSTQSVLILVIFPIQVIWCCT